MSARIAKIAFFVCLAVLALPVAVYAQGNDGGNDGGDAGGGAGGGFGGNNTFFNTGVVGGVMINAKGVIDGQATKIDADVLRRLSEGLNQASADINQQSNLRLISLRGMDNAIGQASRTGQALPAELRYMAGLQRIEYVILSPETNDIIIGGPGEGFKVNESGDVVGATSGTPVIHLEDFLVAMRSVDKAGSGQGVSVSIDPTEQGVKNLQKFFGYLKSNGKAFDPSMESTVSEAMGPQTVNLTGVPADSRFSQVLVAADYKMKRLSMGLESSPINGFPSFMEMAQKANVRNMSSAPRFWMECNYQPVAKSADGNVWQLRGQGVKALTEESHFNKDGQRETGRAPNRFAARWADTMTERFDELAAAEPAFRELRNVMDLSVVAAIIRREQLSEKVGLTTPAILGINTASYTVPKAVATQCSFVRIARSWLVSASGGVQINSWGVAEKTEVNPTLDRLAAMTTPTRDSWWWNAAQN